MDAIAHVGYLTAAILLIVGLKGLSHPRTAARGNLLSALGMLIAVVVTLLSAKIIGWGLLISGLVVGSTIGAFFALRVPMTSMPEFVALFNGLGGGASALVAGGALSVAVVHGTEGAPLPFLIATALSGLIGSLTLFGSMVAVAKLQEKIKSIKIAGKKFWFSDPVLLPGRHVINLILGAAAITLCVLLVLNPTSLELFVGIVICAALLGILLTVPIGGADMPLVIALLNSYSGLAACATGFVIGNNILIIAGSLVGASGLILTNIMCKAMNRSLVNVLFATFGAAAAGPAEDDFYVGRVTSTSAEEIAMLFDGARKVVIVPGYGMAVAQAQHAVRDLSGLLESKGAEVVYGIHPVAGRMPGHMNILLAEADIPYEKLKEMDEVNGVLEQTDVVLVVGANDIVNPVARTDPDSPIAGMPILDVDKAQTVVVVKRSLSPGFAGIPNPLFRNDNTLMFFEDAKAGFLKMIRAVKEEA